MKTRTKLAAVGVVAAVFVAWDIGTRVRSDELPPDCCAHVVVLSSWVNPDTTLGRADHDRLRTAIPLAVRVGANLVTTLVQPASGLTNEPGLTRELEKAGFDRGRWVRVPGVVTSTREEAVATRNALRTAGPIAVVTSPTHTRRACAAFEKVGFVVRCVASGETASVGLLIYTHIREYAAELVYAIRGWT